MLKQGDKAPEVTLIDETGKPIKLSVILAGKNSVIFFYPKDFSLGCTKQACLFRDHYEDFKFAHSQVLGVSSDDAASHLAFKLKYNLNFPLFSDPDNHAAQTFGIKKTLGILPGRATFIFDKNGICKKVFSSQVNITKHLEEILNGLEKL